MVLAQPMEARATYKGTNESESLRRGTGGGGARGGARRWGIPPESLRGRMRGRGGAAARGGASRGRGGRAARERRGGGPRGTDQGRAKGNAPHEALRRRRPLWNPATHLGRRSSGRRASQPGRAPSKSVTWSPEPPGAACSVGMRMSVQAASGAGRQGQLAPQEDAAASPENRALERLPALQCAISSPLSCPISGSQCS